MEEDRSYADVQSVAKEDVDRLRDLVKGINVAMMVTIDPEGKLRSRPMATLEFADDGVVWFLTSGTSGKVEEMEKDHRVHLTYASPGLDRYVAISGIASLADDRSKIRSLWSPMFRAWWPKGADDPDLALVRVVVHEVEYWDAPGRPLFAAVGALRAMAFGKTYDKGQKDHHHLQLRPWPAGGTGTVGGGFGGGAAKGVARPSLSPTGTMVSEPKGATRSKAAVAKAPTAERTPREDLQRDRSRQQSGTGYVSAPADEGAPVRERADVAGEGPRTSTAKKTSKAKAKAKT